MRRVGGALLGLALVAFGSAADAAELVLVLRSTTVEWGQPLPGHVTFTGDGDTGSIDLDALGEAFHVERGFAEVSRIESGTTVRREAVSLYPRRIGEQSVPAMAHGGARSAPVAIRVLPPRPEGASVEVTPRFPDPHVKAGQQLVVRVQVVTTDPRVRVETEAFRLPLAETFLLPASKETVGEQFRHSVGWALFFHAPGDYRVELPRLRYQLFGQDLRKFHLPPLRVAVQQIPAYIPITVPVGRVAIDSHLAGDRHERHWPVRVETDGQLPAGVPELQGALAELAGIEAAAVVTETRVEVRPDGVHAVAELRAPLPPFLLGVGGELPLILRHFDPATGRLQTLVHGLPREWRLPAPVVAAAGLVGFGLVAAITLWGWRAIVRWRARRAFRRQIASAQDPHSLRRLLLAEAGHRTLAGWAAAANGSSPVRALAADLDAACFGAQPRVDLNALREAALRVLRGRPRSLPRPAAATSRRS